MDNDQASDQNEWLQYVNKSVEWISQDKMTLDVLILQRGLSVEMTMLKCN